MNDPSKMSYNCTVYPKLTRLTGFLVIVISFYSGARYCDGMEVQNVSPCIRLESSASIFKACHMNEVIPACRLYKTSDLYAAGTVAVSAFHLFCCPCLPVTSEQAAAGQTARAEPRAERY